MENPLVKNPYESYTQKARAGSLQDNYTVYRNDDGLIYLIALAVVSVLILLFGRPNNKGAVLFLLLSPLLLIFLLLFKRPVPTVKLGDEYIVFLREDYGSREPQVYFAAPLAEMESYHFRRAKRYQQSVLEVTFRGYSTLVYAEGVRKALCRHLRKTVGKELEL